MDPRTQSLDGMRQPRRTAEEMFPLMEQYEESSQTAAAFCAERGISYGQLFYWRRKYRLEAAAAAPLWRLADPWQVKRRKWRSCTRAGYACASLRRYLPRIWRSHDRTGAFAPVFLLPAAGRHAQEL